MSAPDSCDDIAHAKASGNAGLAPSLAVSFEQLAMLLGDAMGDPWTGESEPFEDDHGPGRWFTTQTGHIVIVRAVNETYFHMEYEGRSTAIPSDEAAALAAFERLSGDLGFAQSVRSHAYRDRAGLNGDETTIYAAAAFRGALSSLDGVGSPTVARASVHDPPGGGRRTFLMVETVPDLVNASVVLDELQTNAIASLAARCELHVAPVPEPSGAQRTRSFAVEGGSLGEQVVVYFDTEDCLSSGRWDVTVDVVTGAILRRAGPGGRCTT